MPEVYNWHLGRKMLYPYEERHPKWQFAFVFNINRCLACQTCSMADKSTWLFSKGQEYMWWNNVETKPYGGYPQFYDVKITQLIEQVNPGGQVWNVRVGRKHHAPYGVFEGMTIFDAGAKIGQAAIGYIPTDQEWRFVNIYEDTATSMRALVEGIDKTGFSRDEPWRMQGSSLPEHETFFFYLQRICNHCTYPGCLAACPRKAIYKRPEDGIVLITTPEEAESELLVRIYPVADLINAEVRESQTGFNPWHTDAAEAAASKGGATGLPPVSYAGYDSLLEMLNTTITPESLEELGGPGSVSPLPMARCLVVAQTREIHQLIEHLIAVPNSDERLPWRG
jgi:ferredoxin